MTSGKSSSSHNLFASVRDFALHFSASGKKLEPLFRHQPMIRFRHVNAVETNKLHPVRSRRQNAAYLDHFDARGPSDLNRSLDGTGFDACGVVHLVEHRRLNAQSRKPFAELLERIVILIRARHDNEQNFIWLPIEHALVEALQRARSGQATRSKLLELYLRIRAPEDLYHYRHETRRRRPVESHGEGMTNNRNLLWR